MLQNHQIFFPLGVAPVKKRAPGFPLQVLAPSSRCGLFAAIPNANATAKTAGFFL